MLVTMLFLFHVFLLCSADTAAVCSGALPCFHVRIPSPIQYKKLVEKKYNCIFIPKTCMFHGVTDVTV